MYAELICDSQGIHVHPEMQRLLLHTKGVNRVILVTDSTVYNNPVPEQYAHVQDLNFDHNGGIAGSKLTMDMACRNIMRHTNCGIAQAFLMASTNPARAVGLEDVGSVAKGKVADLVFVDDKFNVQKVMLAGKICRFEEV
jgi:N-acetylglucosamine-6-phosphate deacetylase